MAKIVTITNPLTGQPAQVDQLDHTAQQIDDGIARALPGGAIDSVLSSKPNPWLIDNGVFLLGCLVDQRQGRIVKPNTTYYSDNQLTTAAGTTSAYVTAYRYATGTASGVSYASFKLEDSDTAPTYYAAPENVARGYTSSGYCIDRWRLGNSGALGCITVDTDGLSLHPGATGWNYSEISQLLEDNTIDYLTDKQVTVSALIGGNLYTHTFVLGTNNYVADFAPNFAFISIKALSCHPFFRWTGEVTGFLAAKLDLGTQQTLAHQENGKWVLNEIPDYGEQLARCQRYHHRIRASGSAKIIGLAVAHTASIARFYPAIPSMRDVNLAITHSGVKVMAPGVALASSVSVGSVTGGYHNAPNNTVQLDINLASGFTAGTVYQVVLDDGGYIDLSADL